MGTSDSPALTCSDLDFDPDTCECERADWVVKEKGKPVTFFTAHLCDDDYSPSGYAFSYEAYRVNGEGCLEEIDGGEYWGFSSADDLLDEAYPGAFECAARLDEGDIDEIPESIYQPDDDSWKEGAGKVVCNAVDLLPDTADQRGVFAVPDAYKDMYLKLHRKLDFDESVNAAKKAATSIVCDDATVGSRGLHQS